jgi:hypothetical protein
MSFQCLTSLALCSPLVLPLRSSGKTATVAMYRKPPVVSERRICSYDSFLPGSRHGDDTDDHQCDDFAHYVVMMMMTVITMWE